MDTTTSSIQVIDRLARLLDVIAASDTPVSLKILAAETELQASQTVDDLNRRSSCVHISHYEIDCVLRNYKSSVIVMASTNKSQYSCHILTYLISHCEISGDK